MTTNAFGRDTDPLRCFALVPEACHSLLLDGLTRIVTAWGVAPEGIPDVVDQWRAVLAAELPEQETIEAMRAVARAQGAGDADRARALDERAALIVDQIRGLLVGRSILDWGCGDGRVAARLTEYDVHLLDVGDFRAAALDRPFTHYDETTHSPLGQDFDTVLVLTVLHHARSPGTILHEVARACRERVVVIESVPCVEHASLDAVPAWVREHVRYEYCGLVDWVYNRVVCRDIQVPFNYVSPEGWRALFSAAGMVCVQQETLGVDQNLAPEWHVLMAFDWVRNG